jgi:hypothetical protein
MLLSPCGARKLAAPLEAWEEDGVLCGASAAGFAAVAVELLVVVVVGTLEAAVEAVEEPPLPQAAKAPARSAPTANVRACLKVRPIYKVAQKAFR